MELLSAHWSLSNTKPGVGAYARLRKIGSQYRLLKSSKSSKKFSTASRGISYGSNVTASTLTFALFGNVRLWSVFPAFKDKRYA